MSSYDMNPNYAILSKSLKGMPATNAQYTVHVHVLCLKKTDLHVSNTNLKCNMRILMYTQVTQAHSERSAYNNLLIFAYFISRQNIRVCTENATKTL